MKFKFCYEKIFEKTIHEKIDLICAPINKTQNEIVVSCYISDISNFEEYLNIICEELEKMDISGISGQVCGADFLKDKVHIF